MNSAHKRQLFCATNNPVSGKKFAASVIIQCFKSNYVIHIPHLDKKIIFLYQCYSKNNLDLQIV